MRYTYRMQRSTRALGLTLLFLVWLMLCIWIAVAQVSTQGKLTVTFLNVGQGDAVFIETPSGVQALIDGGKNRAVIRELSRVMPLLDRSLDVVIGTHPDADHIGGLPYVLQRFQVTRIFKSSVEDKEGADSVALERAIMQEIEEGARVYVAQRGQVIELGDGVSIEILFPDRNVRAIETNTGSIVARLSYGATSFMLTGDSPKAIEEYLVLLDAEQLQSSVLKAGHHGSRTSSALSFVGFVAPEYAVFSRGCDNSYGHPHNESVALFARFGIDTLDTCIDGRITFESDGVEVRRK